MTNPTPHGQVPEALRLAHIFDNPLPPEWPDMVAAAAELRRQHTRIAELEAQIEALSGVQALSAAPPSNAEIEKLAAEHLKAFAQFTGAGDVWVEGEVAFARAVLAKWGTPQPVVREPLSDAQIAEMMRDTWGCASIAPRHALEFARAIERAHGIGIKGGQHGAE